MAGECDIGAARGVRGSFGRVVRGQQSMRYTREEGDNYAEGYAVGSEDKGIYQGVNVVEFCAVLQ